MTKVKEFLQALNTLSEKNSFEVFLPSLKRAVKFRPLTTKQQKYFYECLKDNVIFNTKFIITTFNIIKENCFELDIVERITVIDRLLILLSFRKNTIGNEIKIEKDGVIYTTTIDECLQAAEKLALPQNKLVAVKNVQVELHIPTILDQYSLEKELRGTLTEETIEIDTLISTVIVNEVSKSVKEVWLIENDTAVPVGFSSLKHSERIEIVENLPAELMFDLQNYAEEVGNLVDKVLTINTENGPISFNINVDFFLDI